MKKALLIFASVFIFLSVILFFSGLYLKSTGTPRYEGKLALEGLMEPVEVNFDLNGIPHIKANNEHDGYMALGHIMAQDRIFQMDLIRRVYKGELSEILGRKALDSDVLFRTIDVNYGLRQQYEKGLMNPRVVSLFKSYIRGVNAFIEEDNLPFEFKLLGYKPRPFKIMDGLGVLGYMAYSFAQGFKTDPFMEALKIKKGESFTNELRSFPLPELKKRTGKVKHKSMSEGYPPIWLRGHSFVENNIGLFEGSNAWALGPSRTKDGYALLAGDPHVSFSLPGIWYEAHLNWPIKDINGNKVDDFEWYGLFVPGVPFAAMGHGPNHGWAVTISYIDDMDFIKINSTVPVKIKEEKIKVKGQSDYVFKTEHSKYGPLVQNILKRNTERVAMKWGHHSVDNFSPNSFYLAARAKNRAEFESALSLGKSPGLNIIYADREGNIARYLFGEFWKRPRHMTGDQFYSGNREDLVNLETVPFESRPHLINPDIGVVVSANQRPEGTPELKAGYFQPIDRYLTIHEVLKGKEKWGLNEMQIVQTSGANVLFYSLKNRIISSLMPKLGPQSKYLKGLDILKRWDGIAVASSSGALIMYKLMDTFSRLIFKELGEEEFEAYCNTNNFWHVTTRNFLNPKNEKVLEKAFYQTIDKLYENYGALKNWSLGKEQTLTISHPLSRVGALVSFLLDVGPFAIDGGFNTINNMRPVGCKDGLKLKAGPSSRRLISMSDPKESWGVLPLGNSGHYSSPFFNNQWELFKKGKYRRQIMRDLTSAETKFQLLLLPSK